MFFSTNEATSEVLCDFLFSGKREERTTLNYGLTDQDYYNVLAFFLHIISSEKLFEIVVEYIVLHNRVIHVNTIYLNTNFSLKAFK